MPGNEKVSGNIETVHAHNIIKSLVVSFFNEFLLNKNKDFNDTI